MVQSRGCCTLGPTCRQPMRTFRRSIDVATGATSTARPRGDSMSAITSRYIVVSLKNNIRQLGQGVRPQAEFIQHLVTDRGPFWRR